MNSRRKASALLGDIIAVCERMIPRQIVDPDDFSTLLNLVAEVDDVRSRVPEGGPLIGDAEEMLLMALARYADRNHSGLVRAKWAAISIALLDMVRDSLAAARRSEQLLPPPSASEDARAAYPRGGAR